MSTQEKVYAIGHNGYYQTSLSSNHPSIIASKQRNIQLSYRTCNEIFKGPSVFTNQKAEQYYNNYMKNKLLDLQKSQITADTNQFDLSLSNFQDECKTKGKRKRLNSSDINQNFQKQNNQPLLCQTSQFNFQKLGKSAIYSKQTKNQALMQRNCNIITRVQTQQQECANWLHSQEEQKCRNIIMNQQQQIKRLQKLLHEKQNEIRALKHANHTIKDSKHDSYKVVSKEMLIGKQMRQQLGGTTPALLYIMLFMVLFTKHVISN